MTGRVVLALLAWLAVATAASAAGVLRAFSPPFPQAVLLGLTAALLALAGAWAPLRAWALEVDIRALVLFHVTRFVGLYFFVLYGRGQLPWAFAVPGGWGDILVAGAALSVGAAAPRRGRGGWWVYFVWNVAGLADIVAVVATAARLAMRDPGSMRALTTLPLALLLTFVVPIIIATHVVIFGRLVASRRQAYRRL